MVFLLVANFPMAITANANRGFVPAMIGDMVAFHMRLHGKPFKDAAADLVRGGA